MYENASLASFAVLENFGGPIAGLFIVDMLKRGYDRFL